MIPMYNHKEYAYNISAVNTGETEAGWSSLDRTR